MVWYSHLSEFSTVCCDPHSQSFGIVSKAEIDVFLELSWFFDDPADVGNLISGSSALSKSMSRPVTLKKLKLNSSMKTYKTF